MIEDGEQQVEPLEYTVLFHHHRAQAADNGDEGGITSWGMYHILIEEREQFLVGPLGGVITEFAVMLLNVGFDNLNKVVGEW